MNVSLRVKTSRLETDQQGAMLVDRIRYAHLHESGRPPLLPSISSGVSPILTAATPTMQTNRATSEIIERVVEMSNPWDHSALSDA